jgi:hypothetical protein
MFMTLLNLGLQMHFSEWCQRAVAVNGCLNVQLDIDMKLAEVSSLPWEFLRQPASGGRPPLWLSTESNMTLTRRRVLESVTIPAHVEEPLKILVVVASPENLPPVDYQEVTDNLGQLAKHYPDRIYRPEVLLSASLDSLDQALQEHQPHLVHFIGHGKLSKPRAMGAVALIGPDGRLARWVPDETFSTVLTRHKPHCVILQACEGAATPESQALAGVGSHLVQRNTPLVIAFQFPVSNHIAAAFCNSFYESLFAGYTVAAATQEARRQLSLRPQLHTKPDFASPLLFMQGKPERLFSIRSSEKEKQTVDAVPDWSLENREALRLKIKSAFSLEELEILCSAIAELIRQDTDDKVFKLSLDDLEGKARESKIHHLIEFLDRRGGLRYLLKAVDKMRPGLLAKPD